MHLQYDIIQLIYAYIHLFIAYRLQEKLLSLEEEQLLSQQSAEESLLLEMKRHDVELEAVREEGRTGRAQYESRLGRVLCMSTCGIFWLRACVLLLSVTYSLVHTQYRTSFIHAYTYNTYAP